MLRMKRIIIYSLSLIIISLAYGDSNRLNQLRAQKEAAVKKGVDPIEEKYKAALKKLLKVLTASGDLEAAVEVEEEIAKPKNSSTEKAARLDKRSSRLDLLREQRESAIKDVTDPVTSRYMVELEKLKQTMTTAGDLKDAVEVRNEIAIIKGTPVGDIEGGDASELRKELVGTSWELKQGGGIVLLKFGDGQFRVHKKESNGEYLPGDTRDWKIEDAKRRRIRIFWHYGEEVATLNSKMTMMKDTRHVMKRVSD